MKKNPAVLLFAMLGLSILMIATVYQNHLANAQIAPNPQNQAQGQSESSVCINGVCTNSVCNNNNCGTDIEIRCVNGKCESISSSVTNQFP
jgi:uncharacterized low-complexity protein